ncbi:hypothetical protein JTE90_020908 [Oedothorax gibbosus]|uniref:Uncharacterized protein n=1 Tax=Oedothorax gibbosus TaxID=931172 RepID=A0AAV6VQQ2_9ARAC|nr:hypothetical protein JTE90_020908 [Oedothorax gibbosus]
MSSKPPFHHLNGRRQQYVQRPMPESPHYEVIKYIHDSWKNICREIDVSKSCGAEGKPSTIAYYSSNLPEEQFPRPDFKRFDLDAFLEQRSLAIQANKQPSQ